jgi:hypothetical protein
MKCDTDPGWQVGASSGNAGSYGKGLYFSTSLVTSAQHPIVEDGCGRRTLLLCKVLVGRTNASLAIRFLSQPNTCHPAKFRELMYGGKHGAVIGWKARICVCAQSESPGYEV